MGNEFKNIYESKRPIVCTLGGGFGHSKFFCKSSEEKISCVFCAKKGHVLSNYPVSNDQSSDRNKGGIKSGHCAMDTHKCKIGKKEQQKPVDRTNYKF